MGRGILKIQTVAAGGYILIGNAEITITDVYNNVVQRLSTNETGGAPDAVLMCAGELCQWGITPNSTSGKHGNQAHHQN